MTKPRDVAFLALDAYFREGIFVDETLEKFKKDLSMRDFALAYELASGVVRRKNTLDTMAVKLLATPKKRPEKVLLRLCLYQMLFLDRIPDFAIGDEMVGLAKRYTSVVYAKFLNSFLRKNLSNCSLDDLTELEKLSYPDFFSDRLVARYGKNKALEIMELGNTKVPHFARDRQEMTMVALDGKNLDDFATNKRYYIQNPTQFAIYSELKNGLKAIPKSILDLTASPGGKTILLHDFFPDAVLFANDLNDKKVAKLKENLKKYKIDATLSAASGLQFPEYRKFDLVVVDAPCSNTGCLYKCPEARWRLNAKELEASVDLQRKLLQKAINIVAPGGTIWYSTCSILPEENEELVASIPQLKVLSQTLVLPNKEGNEGGFGAFLTCAK